MPQPQIPVLLLKDYGGVSYMPNGIFLNLPTYCTSGAVKVYHKVEGVLIDASGNILPNYQLGAKAATKLTNNCTNDYQIVKETHYNVLGGLNRCCNSVGVPYASFWVVINNASFELDASTSLTSGLPSVVYEFTFLFTNTSGVLSTYIISGASPTPILPLTDLINWNEGNILITLKVIDGGINTATRQYLKGDFSPLDFDSTDFDTGTII